MTNRVRGNVLHVGKYKDGEVGKAGDRQVPQVMRPGRLGGNTKKAPDLISKLYLIL